MVYIISLILILLALVKKNSKIVFYMIFVLLIILLGGNTDNPDRFSYMNTYTSIANGMFVAGYEFGFQMLCKIGSLLGLTYDQFLFIIAFIGVGLIVRTIKLYTSNISYVLALYFIYPFVWDVVQIRNFLAMSIIVFGSKYIISYKKEYFKYIICVLIASTIHSSSIIYLSALLIVIKNTKKLFGGVTLLTVISIILMPIILRFAEILTLEGKVEVYTSTQTSMFTKICVVIFYICSTILVLIAMKTVMKEYTDNCTLESMDLSSSLKTYKGGFLRLKRKNVKKMPIDAESILKINIILMFCLYFLMNNLNFFRIYRNIFVLNYILFAQSFVKMKKNTMYYFLFVGILIFIVILSWLLTIYLQTTNIFEPVFNNNIIFDWIRLIF